MGMNQQATAEQDLRQLVVALGGWFEGFCKFAMIVNGRCENLDNGQMLMIQRLAQESRKINLLLHEWRQRYQQEAVRQVQRRLIDEGKVGAALNASYDEFWKDFLQDNEREVLPGGFAKEKAFNLCLWEPLAALFKESHDFDCLGEGVGAELLAAAVNDGVVRLLAAGVESLVTMVGCTPVLQSGQPLTEYLASVVECEIQIGGLGVELSPSTEGQHKFFEVRRSG